MVGTDGWAAKLAANQQAFIQGWVQRARIPGTLRWADQRTIPERLNRQPGSDDPDGGTG